MYCSMCGNEIPEDAKFCGKCGAKNELLFEKELTPDVPNHRNITTQEEYTVQELNSPQKAYSVQEENSPHKENTVQELNTPQEAYSVHKENTPQKVYSVQELNTPQEAYTVQELNTPQEAYSVQEENTPQKAYSVQAENTPQKENLPQEENSSQNGNSPHKEYIPVVPEIPIWQPGMATNQPVPSFVPISVEKNRDKKTKGKALILSLASVLLIALCVVGFLWYTRVYLPDNYEKHLVLGEEYLSEGNYDKAIAAYHDAIDLMSDREEAHIGLSNTYIAMGEFEQALATLELAYDSTQSEKIKEQIEQFEQEFVSNEITDVISDAVVEEPELDQATPQVNPIEEQVQPVEQEAVDILVRQVDNTNFPHVKFYASVNDLNGESVDKLKAEDFIIQEIDSFGNTVEVKINDLYQVISSDQIFVNLVLDKSDSMNEYEKMSQAQDAAKSFVKKVDLGGGDSVEIISFDDYVYLEQEFTSEEKKLTSAINGMQTGGSTALYDAIYAGLLQSYYEDGSKCVIVFTDGQENASSYTWDDVVDMARNTGIPVFIIGIGADYDESALTSLAQECSGSYYSAATTDLTQILEEIYYSIYQDTQEYFVFEYESPNTSDTSLFRDIMITTSEVSQYIGTATKHYVPQADISGDFSSLYASIDFMIEDSNVRAITAYDLAGMSLAQLRIARNEIFARHGRQFKDSALNKWFYSKTWYLNIGMKYAPESFDAISPSPLSKLESDNANIIKDYEKQIMENQDIFPDASNELLSEYDLALSKSVLKKALEQMQTYFNTDVLQENLSRVQEAIDQEDISY